MSFFDKVTKAVGDVVDKGKKDVDQFIKIQKLNGEIGGFEKKIAALKGQIAQVKQQAGEKAIELAGAGSLDAAAIRPFVEQVAGLEQQIAAEEENIAAKKAEIDRVKAEHAAEHAAEHHAAAASTATETAVPPAVPGSAPAAAESMAPPPLPTATTPAPAPEPATGPKFCTACGAQLTGGTFCTQCGAKLG